MTCSPRFRHVSQPFSERAAAPVTRCSTCNTCCSCPFSSSAMGPGGSLDPVWTLMMMFSIVEVPAFVTSTTQQRTTTAARSQLGGLSSASLLPLPPDRHRCSAGGAHAEQCSTRGRAGRSQVRVAQWQLLRGANANAECRVIVRSKFWHTQEYVQRTSWVLLTLNCYYLYGERAGGLCCSQRACDGSRLRPGQASTAAAPQTRCATCLSTTRFTLAAATTS